MIGPDEAAAQAEALRTAAEASPVRQLRYQLVHRAREWERAATNAVDADGEGGIEMLGAVVGGMYAFFPDDQDNWRRVIRTLNNGGQSSLHVNDDFDPRGRYLNFIGPDSPVVIKL